MKPSTPKPERDHYTCFSCGLKDPQVEAAGIYYCPNPFCHGSGATNWKVENLVGVQKGPGGILLTGASYQDWLGKGRDVVNKMPYELGAKIMALRKTKGTIKRLQEVK